MIGWIGLALALAGLAGMGCLLTLCVTAWLLHTQDTGDGLADAEDTRLRLADALNDETWDNHVNAALQIVQEDKVVREAERILRGER